MASTPGLILFDPTLWADTLSTVSVTSSTNKAGGIYRAPKTGNIRYVGFSLFGVATPGTLEVRAETVSSSRVPSGTLFGTNTNNAAVSSPSAQTFTWFQLTADAAVTAGDQIAAVVQWGSTFSGTLYYAVSRSSQVAGPHAVINTGSWTIAANAPVICLKYDDGTIVPGGVPINTLTQASFNSGSTPRERATVFTPQFNCTCAGAKVLAFPTASGTTWELGIYSGTSTTPLATAPVNANIGSSIFSAFTMDVRFASPVSLTASTAYRLAVRATHASNNINTVRYVFPSTAERDAVMGQATSDTRAGSSWIGETTTISELISPIIDTVTATAGSSGGFSVG